MCECRDYTVGGCFDSCADRNGSGVESHMVRTGLELGGLACHKVRNIGFQSCWGSAVVARRRVHRRKRRSWARSGSLGCLERQTEHSSERPALGYTEHSSERQAADCTEHLSASGELELGV